MRALARGGAVLLLVVAALCSSGSAAHADGPFTSRVIDAETRRPITGAVVLAYWIRLLPIGGHTPEVFEDAIEVTTDDNGQFTIPRRSHVGIGHLEGPFFVIFAPGYAFYPLFQVEPQNKSDEDVQNGATVVLRRWASEKERLRIFEVQNFVSQVPPERMPRLSEAVNAEERATGLAPEPLGRRTR
jgi:hypothetical protein